MSLIEQIFERGSRLWQDLIERAQAAWRTGDFDQANELFAQLQERSVSWLLAIARRRLPANSVDDVVSETYIALWQKAETGDVIQNVKGLLGTILRRRIADEYRRQKGVVMHADDTFWEHYSDSMPAEEVGPEQVVEERELAAAVTNIVLDALPTPERDVLIARHVDELSVMQTAARLDITEDQVKKRTQQAVRRVRQIMIERGLHHDTNP